MQNYSFKEIHNALKTAESKLHPSILHGLVTGLCCSGFNADNNWQSFLIDESENSSLMASLIEKLFAHIDEQLNDIEFSFEPLLPDDSSSLTLRTKCMIGWSQSFVRSYEWAKQQHPEPLDLDIEQFITEIMSISELDVEEVDEEEEQDFLEVFDYLKVCVLNVYTETGLKQRAAEKATKTTQNAQAESKADASWDENTTIH